MKNENLNQIESLKCETCAYFSRDYTTQASGWCPFPKNRSTTPADPAGKYVYQSRRACKQYKKREKQIGMIREDRNLQELFRLIRNNPELPILPMVDSDIVADDNYGWWMGSWGNAEVTGYYSGEEGVHFYEPDDWDSIEEALNDAATVDFDFDNQSDEKALAAYNGLPWKKAIVVYIRLPQG